MISGLESIHESDLSIFWSLMIQIPAKIDFSSLLESIPKSDMIPTQIPEKNGIITPLVGMILGSRCLILEQLTQAEKGALVKMYTAWRPISRDIL